MAVRVGEKVQEVSDVVPSAATSVEGWPLLGLRAATSRSRPISGRVSRPSWRSPGNDGATTVSIRCPRERRRRLWELAEQLAVLGG